MRTIDRLDGNPRNRSVEHFGRVAVQMAVLDGDPIEVVMGLGAKLEAIAGGPDAATLHGDVSRRMVMPRFGALEHDAVIPGDNVAIAHSHVDAEVENGSSQL